MKKFEMGAHEDLIRTLSQPMPTQEFESACEPIVLDILVNYEGFVSIEKGPAYPGTPFDYFGWRGGLPYVVEFKGSRHRLNFPGKTQQQRLLTVLGSVCGIHAALLQVRVCDGHYRMLYDDELTQLFTGREAPMQPIADWLRSRIQSP